MTNKQAIEVLKDMVLDYGYASHREEVYEAVGMAVEALEQPEEIRCKDCKHRIVNHHYGEKGFLQLKAMCELDTGDVFQLGRCADNDEWHCADAERRTDEPDKQTD